MLVFVDSQAQTAQYKGAGVSFIDVRFEAGHRLLNGVGVPGCYAARVQEEVEPEVAHQGGEPASQHLEEVLFGQVEGRHVNVGHRVDAEIVRRPHPIDFGRVDWFRQARYVEDYPLRGVARKWPDEHFRTNLVAGGPGGRSSHDRIDLDAFRPGGPW